LELMATITAARVQAALGNAQDVSESRRRLGRVIADAKAGAFEDVGREARLALGEMELSSGNPAAGRAQLETLEKDSANAGVLLIARRAAAALHTASNRAAN